MYYFFTRLRTTLALFACCAAFAHADKGDVIYTYFPATANASDATAVAECQQAGYAEIAAAVTYDKSNLGAWMFNDNKRRLCLAYDIAGAPVEPISVDSWAFLKPVEFAQAATYTVDFQAINQYAGQHDAAYEVWLCSAQSEEGLVKKVFEATIDKAVLNSFIDNGEPQGATSFSFDLPTPGSYGLAIHVVTEVPGTTSYGNGCRFRNIVITQGDALADVPEGIGTVTVQPSTRGIIYNLAGQRVTSTGKLPKGVYLVDGRKVCVR